MAALEPSSHDMQRYITENIPAHIFRDGKFHDVELKYKDIRLDLNIKNNTCFISAFSRGHYVRERPEHRIMHRPALHHEPASSKGEGAIFVALVVLHCNKFVPIKWTTSSVSEWWNLKGVCSIKDACTITKDGVTIDNKKFIIWSQTILMLPVDIELETIQPVQPVAVTPKAITGKFMSLQDSIESDRELQHESRGGKKSKRKKSKKRKTRKY
jgi:hypothetical protein